MLTCETCGEILPDGTQFCSNCGAPVGTGSPKPDAGNTPMPDIPLPYEAPAPTATDNVTGNSDPQQSDSGNPYQSTSDYGNPQTPPQQPYEQPNYGQPSDVQPNGYGAQPPYGQPNNFGAQQPYGQGNYGQPNNFGAQQPYGQPNYGQPTYPPMPNRQPKQTDGKAVAGLIMGILSLLNSCAYGTGIIFGVLGIIFSSMSKKNEKKQYGASSSNGMATAGMVCSIIGCVISVIVLLGVILALVFGYSLDESGVEDYYNNYDQYQDAARMFLGRFGK